MFATLESTGRWRRRRDAQRGADDVADQLPFAPTTTTVAPTTTTTQPPAPPSSGGGCHPSDDPCLPITGDDHRLDADGDGRGCESY